MIDLLEPIAKYGAALVAASALVWWVHYLGARRASSQAQLDAATEVLNGLSRARKARQRLRKLGRRDRIDRL